jgi:SRSO17 transposase
MTGGTVMDEEIGGWPELFLAFHARFAPCFYRAEVRERSRAYLQALLDQVERKNGWQLAEAMGEADPNGAQRLLYAAVWDADAVRDELQRFVAEAFGQPDGILVVDESGVAKKGDQSVGVAKRYCGSLGKVGQCQVGVYLTYASALGHAFLDRRLFLPEEWTEDAARCREAKVPAAVTFAGKPQPAQAMLAHAFALGIPAAWVTGDEIYGSAPALRTSLERRPCAYVLAVRRNEPPTVPPPVPKPRLVGLLETAASATAKLPADAWERHSAGAGSKGERWDDWAWLPLAEATPAGWRKWLLVRRSLDDGELASYRVFAPEGTSPETLVPVAGSRWTIEQCLEEAEGEAGLDQYEVRHRHSRHRQITLSLLAHAFPAWLRQRAHGFDLATAIGGKTQRQHASPGHRGRHIGGGERAGGATPPGAGLALAPASAPAPAQLAPLAPPPPSPRHALPLPSPPAPHPPIIAPSLI